MAKLFLPRRSAVQYSKTPLPGGVHLRSVSYGCLTKFGLFQAAID